MSRDSRYNKSPKGRERYRRYRASKKGIINDFRSDVRHVRKEREERNVHTDDGQ